MKKSVAWIVDRIGQIGKLINSILFDRQPVHRLAFGISIFLLFAVFLVGIAHWVFFFNSGNLTFTTMDWPKEKMYYDVLKQAISKGKLPYYIHPATQYTDRFLAIPETNLSPQFLLLSWLDFGELTLVNILLLYIAGFAGLIALKQHFRMPLAVWLLVFFVFNFNGHITSHLAVGHSMWGGYFLLPWFFLLVFQLSNVQKIHVWGFKIGLVLFVILLQGSFHIFIGCLIFVGLILLTNLKWWKPLLIALAYSLGLAACRLMPALFTYTSKPYELISGYPSLMVMLDVLLNIHEPTISHVGGLFGKLGWWEYDVFIGLAGLALLVLGGIILRFKKADGWDEYQYKWLDIPIVGMALLSINYFYAIFAWMPFFNAERVPARMFILPVLALLFLAGARFSFWTEKHSEHAKNRWLLLAGIFCAAFPLIDHSNMWRVEKIERVFEQIGPYVGSIASKSIEPVYLFSLIGGLAITLISVLIYLIIQSRATFPSSK